jgi:hypothetical protein
VIVLDHSATCHIFQDSTADLLNDYSSFQADDELRDCKGQGDEWVAADTTIADKRIRPFPEESAR